MQHLAISDAHAALDADAEIDAFHRQTQKTVSSEAHFFFRGSFVF
jgi:hypothetical protein